MLQNKQPKLSPRDISGLTNRVIHGDNLQVMLRIPTGGVDLVLTDPPYVVNYRPRDGRSVAGDTSPAWIEPAFREIHRVLKPDSFCISFYGWHRPERFFNAWHEVGFSCVGHFVWVKPYPSGHRYVRYRHEQAFLLAKGKPKLPEKPIEDVLQWEYTGNKLHPTEKAVSALLPIVGAFSRAGEVVLDPFCGSGSTLVAAAELGRRFIGIELDRQHWQTAEERLRELRCPESHNEGCNECSSQSSYSASRSFSSIEVFPPDVRTSGFTHAPINRRRQLAGGFPPHLPRSACADGSPEKSLASFLRRGFKAGPVKT